MSEEKGGTLREHEKFWAFIILVAAILLLALLAILLGKGSNAVTDAQMMVLNAKLRIIDVSIAGLIGIAGMAAQALFRVSSIDKLSAETALEAARKLPEPIHATPQPVEVVNKPSDPVPTKAEAPVEEDSNAGLPESMR